MKAPLYEIGQEVFVKVKVVGIHAHDNKWEYDLKHVTIYDRLYPVRESEIVARVGQ